MTTLIKHKRVEFSELFYDLVFVFAISKATALIHPLHSGVVAWDSLLDFFISVMVIINSWMIQTIYTNRYGTNSLFNMVIMFINMGLMLFMSNMIGYNWQQWFYYTCWAVGTLTLTLFFQYLVEFFRKSTDNTDRESIKGFLWLTGLGSLGVYLAALFPIYVGVYIFIASILLTFIVPIFLITKDEHFQVNLPHLIERVSLLVIITFGEMVVGLASFFTVENFSIYSVLNFVIMLSLFLFYFGEFDHAIDEGSSQKGLFVIYSHYPIFIGLMLMTVSMGYLLNPEANLLVAISFFYIGIGLFQAAVLANGPYNKNYLRYPRSYYCAQATLYLAALILSLLFASNPITVLSIATIFTLAIAIHFIYFYVTQNKKYSKSNWGFF
ncbi:low temperature requirement protein LtrA [Streptococcus sp. CM6]|jgi:bacterial low temperature requirement A protein (ltrA)|uniref:Low temperature requirement protein LtrA n=2 Tax=Streptococcus oralis TaxID=1303 RepID=F9LVV3_STROR|nr:MULTISPECIES: low temperature requirement protein A [Streptococcus]EGU67661.1 low temperature requirement protein LtrA [Streptococcus mitis bv. 2 str. SK95]EUC81278.1 low temperature requirement protein LtrA [Streptococcus sp. CM6]MCP8994549.1 low temperature requirement protein A [Streptococcus sp. CF9-3]MCP8997876.1 low temperature requirement protein A [Streptococcus sp. CF9-1]MDO6228383.1 low temperature requirement protein A [Streptococcus infantis]